MDSKLGVCNEDRWGWHVKVGYIILIEGFVVEAQFSHFINGLLFIRFIGVLVLLEESFKGILIGSLQNLKFFFF